MICSRCKVDKTLDWFTPTNYKRGFKSQCKACRNEKQAEQRKALRIKTINIYGGAKCSAEGCSVTDIKKLEINHIAGFGSEHRKKLFGRDRAGHNFWYWLKKNGWPDGFNVLCHHHNKTYKPSNKGDQHATQSSNEA